MTARRHDAPACLARRGNLVPVHPARQEPRIKAAQGHDESHFEQDPNVDPVHLIAQHVVDLLVGETEPDNFIGDGGEGMYFMIYFFNSCASVVVDDSYLRLISLRSYSPIS